MAIEFPLYLCFGPCGARICLALSEILVVDLKQAWAATTERWRASVER